MADEFKVDENSHDGTLGREVSENVYNETYEALAPAESGQSHWTNDIADIQGRILAKVREHFGES
jgi:hypothetical protein